MTAEEPIRPQNPDQWIEDLIADRKRLREENVAQAATIRERDEEIAKLQGIIMGTSTEARVTLGVNLRRYWSADYQAMLGRMLFDEDVPALRVQNAAQAEEIERLNQRVFDTHKGMLDRDANAQKCKRESAELRARCERYEGLILRHESEIDANGENTLASCNALDVEARAIRARREQEKHGQA